MKKISSDIAVFLIILALVFWAAAVGGYFTSTSAGTWYKTIERPAFSPPNWLFGPVWTFLYISMIISAFVFYKSAPIRKAPTAAGFFLFQLVLNGVWPWLFFARQDPQAGFIELLFLVAAVIVTILLFYRQSKTAAVLLVPYLLWISFASVLNGWIMLNN